MEQRRRALLSVSDKTGLVGLGQRLVEMGWELIASGGTGKALAEAGVPFVPVEQVNGNPEAFDGRMKTISFQIESAILFDRTKPSHVEEAQRLGIVPIDMVVCNFYPFDPERADVELIDVGGPTMVRAAAKNYHSVVVLVDPADYEAALWEMKGLSGMPSLDQRRGLAQKAFDRLSRYDASIADALHVLERMPEHLGFNRRKTLVLLETSSLRYGENPHQSAKAYLHEPSPLAVHASVQVQGKELSYNNLLDADGALNALCLIGRDRPAACIVKHTNPCGAALADDVGEAFDRAWAGDPTAAFGGIAAVNRLLDGTTTERMLADGRFLEVLLAPGADDEARGILAKRKNLRVLLNPALERPTPATGWEYRSIRGGLLAQELDSMELAADHLTCPTDARPTDAQRADLLFAWQICRVSKSNAVTLVKDQQLVGNGVGQQDRVGSCRIAVQRAGDRAKGAVAASDAFFPFPDGPEVLAQAGITAIIQPGGSVRDQETIDACNRHGVAMLLTGGIRCFKH